MREMDTSFVVGGLPDGVQENYVYEYDQNFQFVQKHIIASGHTFLGIQSAAFHEGRWYFGCYGKPSILLVTNADFKMIGRYEYNCLVGNRWHRSRRIALRFGFVQQR